VGLWADLKAAGVAGDKHIPHAYLWGDIQTRWDVLCGLIDSDGSIAVSGQVLFANTNTLLAKQTAQLIRSLGYRVGEHVVPPRTSSSGIVGKLPVHIVTYSPRDGMVPARLARKAGKIKGTAQHRRISIVSVEPVEPRPGRCITVASRRASACLRACGTTASGQRLGARRRRQPNAQRASPRDAQRAVEGVGRMFAVSCRCMTTPTVALRPVKRSRSSW
jgi:hypothetical protein